VWMLDAVRTQPLAVDTLRSSFADGKLWYAVYTKSQFEFAVARAFDEKQYENFLPLYRSQRRWSDRVKEIEMPLFRGYLFCRFDARNPWDVLNSPGVVYVVSAGKQFLPVDEGEIESLRALCRSGPALEPWPYLNVGRRVMVERWPLVGTEGIVVELKKKMRIVVSVSMLQRSVAAEIDRDWIRPLWA